MVNGAIYVLQGLFRGRKWQSLIVKKYQEYIKMFNTVK
jgi:hypothetical protein